MSREKQIEEIANILWHIPGSCFLNSYDDCVRIAKYLYDDAGYRKQSEVVDEFVKRLKEEPIKLSLPLFGLSTKDEIEEHFNDIMLEVRDAIDQIAKERNGIIRIIMRKTKKIKIIIRKNSSNFCN